MPPDTGALSSSTTSGSAPNWINVERHEGDEPAVCVGQWCCGCAVHPIGKPWGWNCDAWAEHYERRHPITTTTGEEPR